MIRELFRIGSISISPFGVLMAVAFIAAWAQLRWGLRRLRVGDEEDASALLLSAGIGGIIGAKLYYAALYQDWRLIFDRSGLVWYGALLAGTVAVLWTARLRRLSLPPTVDAVVPGVVLGYGIGRIGCFLVGDDYGLPTTLPWGVRFPEGLPAPTTAAFLRSEYGAEIPAGIAPDELVAVHPTQLYETLAALLIWYLGVRAIRRGAGDGRSGLLLIGLLGVERFLVEFVRAKDDRLLGSLTLAQLLSVAVVLVVIAIAFALSRSEGRRERARTVEKTVQ